MCSLQLSNCRGFEQSEVAAIGFSHPRRSSAAVIRSSFLGGGLDLCDAEARARRWRLLMQVRRGSRVCAELKTKMNLNEFMVTLEKPLGIRFAVSIDGKVFVHALQKGGNAEKSRMIMVGDTPMHFTKGKYGAYSLVFERSSDAFPIHELYRIDDKNISFNRSFVPIASWNKNTCSHDSSGGSGSSGFVVFSPKLLTSQGWKYLNDWKKIGHKSQVPCNGSGWKYLNDWFQSHPALPFSSLVAIFTEGASENAEWGHGSFPLEAYAKDPDTAAWATFKKMFIPLMFFMLYSLIPADLKEVIRYVSYILLFEVVVKAVQKALQNWLVKIIE